MGITGLIPFCEKATTQTTLVKFRGKTVAVDSYCLLHKGSYSCADKLAKKIKTTAHIDYCLKYVDMLLKNGLKPIMVFDGKNLSAKAQTELNRRNSRQEAKKKAEEFMKQGKPSEARKEYVKAVDITHEDANQLMQECRKIGVDCITAMYEADSQLAYLNKIKLAELIISEDSDLILFGCDKILFKLTLDGRCLFFDAKKLHLTIDVPEEKFCFEKFRRICILSGCDYLNSLHGIGLGKAKKFMLLTEETDMGKALPKLPSYLNMKKLEVTEEYIDGFLKAEATFKHMFIYDPVRREMLRLNSITDNDNPEHCVNAGEMLDPRTAFQLALGNINPRGNNPIDCFDPDVSGKPTKERSIWARSMFTPKVFNSSSPGLKHAKLTKVQNIIDQENDVTTEVEIDDLVTSYSEISTTKRRNTDEEEENGYEEVQPQSRNPFAKRHQPEEKKIVTEKPSLLKKISLGKFKNIEGDSRVVSRFFPASTAKAFEAKAEDEKEAKEMAEMIKSVDEERQKKRQEFYDAFKTENSQQSIDDDKESTDEGIASPEVQDDVVDLDTYQCKVKAPKPIFFKPKPAMPVKSKSRPAKGKGALTKQKSQESSVQKLLSAFGFQKQPTMTFD